MRPDRQFDAIVAGKPDFNSAQFDDWPPSSAMALQCREPPLPGLMPAHRIAHERGQRSAANDQMVGETAPKAAGANDVHEEDDADARGVVLDVVLVRIVEKQAPAFLPVSDLTAHDDAAALGGLGYQQTQMVAKKPLPWPAMRW